MKNVIKSLNDNYSDYLGNINLETAAYNNLATALRNASDALVQKKISEIMVRDIMPRSGEWLNYR
jgi:hypothetical protein